MISFLRHSRTGKNCAHLEIQKLLKFWDTLVSVGCSVNVFFSSTFFSCRNFVVVDVLSFNVLSFDILNSREDPKLIIFHWSKLEYGPGASAL
jgi:hypothetical protein